MTDQVRSPLKQLFRFEKSAVQLQDGSWFQPMRVAVERWVRDEPAPYRMSGTYYQVLYELKDGSFVQIDLSAPMSRGGIWASRIIDDQGDVVGSRVDAFTALAFLQGEFEIPESLQSLLDAPSSSNAEQEYVPPEPRSLDRWDTTVLVEHGKEKAHAIRVAYLLPVIRDRTYSAVQEIRCWKELPPGSRDHRETILLSFALMRRYRVEHANWWGSKSRVPPESVDVLELRWPDGVPDLKTDVLPELRGLVVQAGTVLFCASPVGHLSGSPTEEEVELAERHLMDNLAAIEERAVQLNCQIEKLLSGAVHEQLVEEAPKTQKPPNDNEMAAYVLRVVLKHELSEIKKRLKVTAHIGTISRWVENARKWFEAGNPLPAHIEAMKNEPTSKAKPAQSMDPALIDMRGRKTARKSSRKKDD